MKFHNSFIDPIRSGTRNYECDPLLIPIRRRYTSVQWTCTCEHVHLNGLTTHKAGLDWTGLDWTEWKRGTTQSQFKFTGAPRLVFLMLDAWCLLYLGYLYINLCIVVDSYPIPIRRLNYHFHYLEIRCVRKQLMASKERSKVLQNET
jgi:hypothetical protein